MLAAVVQLHPLPVDRLTSLDQHFRCVPYSATITAETCIERQNGHNGKIAISAWGKAHPDKVESHAFRRSFFGACADCELGRRVAAQLGVDLEGGSDA